jgi:hypothetical protein
MDGVGCESHEKFSLSLKLAAVGATSRIFVAPGFARALLDASRCPPEGARYIVAPDFPRVESSSGARRSQCDGTPRKFANPGLRDRKKGARMDHPIMVPDFTDGFPL